MNDRQQALTALTASTVAFTVCFACWVINAVLITFLFSRDVFDFDTAQVGWLLALPILTGAVSRVPLGILTDRYGGRRVFFILMLVTALPLFLVSFAERYSHFLWASLGYGLAGGGFAVGVGYVSPWFRQERQGTALGIFGMGNAGAALTTLVAPLLLGWLTGGADPDAWRWLPRIYALILLVTAAGFFIVTKEWAGTAGGQTLAQRLEPLASPLVWRFGLYYFLVFGAFVAIAQWLLPYSVNVYAISLTQAGLLAALFSLPSGVIRALGGWLSDRFGARTVMYWVFGSCFVSCLILSIPKMNIASPGPGVAAKMPGEVTAVTAEAVVVGERRYAIAPPPARTPAETDAGGQWLPSVTIWQEPLVAVGDEMVKDQLLARGVTNIYYPANLWLFAALVFVFGVATGVGKAGVYKLIPEQFPNAVGAVGGMVGLLGALGGFVLPPLFGYLLQGTGLWSSCWIVLAVISLICLIELHLVVRRIMQEEAPDLVQLIERRPPTAAPVPAMGEEAVALERLLPRIPFFSDLSPGELNNLVKIGGYKSVEAGETVFKAGDPGDALYVLLTGSVRVHHPDDQGRDVELKILRQGEVFGELALIDGEPRSATVTTLGPCRLFLIGRREFLTLLAKTPRMLADILVSLSSKIRQTNARYFDSIMQQERLQAQQEIERHRAIAQMVAGVAHEINTPLGIVNHAASILSGQLRPDTIPNLAKDETAAEELRNAADAAALIQSNIARADRLITSFKNLSVRQISEQRETVDIRALTREVADLYKLKARHSRLDLEIIDRVAGDGLWEGYPGQYSQVLLNLLENAHRYAYPQGQGGRVEIQLADAANPQGYELSVRDFGRGIAQADLAKVFEPFYTTGRNQGGSGLGLAIVRNLVTAGLGGNVDIDSAPDQGTTVTVTVPKVVEAPASA